MTPLDPFSAVQHEVAAVYGVSPEEQRGPRGSKWVTLARHVAMYLARKLPGVPSFPDIGRAFGLRHHSVVMYAVRRIEALRGEDAREDQRIAELEARMGLTREEPAPDVVPEMAVWYEAPSEAEVSVAAMRARAFGAACVRAGVRP